MNKITITTRGLSPLEEQIAELALSIKEIGEKLPANLAKKLVNEVRRAASTSSKYYFNISGRKNYAVEDIAMFIRDLPENTAFTYRDITKKFRHNPVSVDAVLRKLHDTDDELDFAKLQIDYFTHAQLYVKPSNSDVNLNKDYKSKFRDSRIVASPSYDFSSSSPTNVLELTKRNMEKAKNIIRHQNERCKREVSGNFIPKNEVSISIAKEIVSRAEKEIFQKINENLKEKGYITNYSYYNKDFDLSNSAWWEPRIIVTRGNKRDIYKIEIIDYYKSRGLGNKNRVIWDDLIKECFENSGLISPRSINEEIIGSVKYDPKIIRELRAQKYFSEPVLLDIRY